MVIIPSEVRVLVSTCEILLVVLRSYTPFTGGTLYRDTFFFFLTSWLLLNCTLLKCAKGMAHVGQTIESEGGEGWRNTDLSQIKQKEKSKKCLC